MRLHLQLQSGDQIVLKFLKTLPPLIQTICFQQFPHIPGRALYIEHLQVMLSVGDRGTEIHKEWQGVPQFACERTDPPGTAPGHWNPAVWGSVAAEPFSPSYFQM